MYGLSRDLNLAFFGEQTLLQVCFGANDVIFNFDGEVSITVTSAVGWKSQSGDEGRSSDFATAAMPLLALIDQRVSRATGDDAGTLHLHFENGAVLSIYDDSTEFESYVIRNGDQIIVI